MTFWKVVGAYLTGWVIAQTVFTRVVRYMMRDQSTKQWAKFHIELAQRTAPLLIEEMDKLSTGEGYHVRREGIDALAARTFGHLAGGEAAMGGLPRELPNVSEDELAAAMAAAAESVLAEARSNARRA